MLTTLSLGVIASPHSWGRGNPVLTSQLGLALMVEAWIATKAKAFSR